MKIIVRGGATTKGHVCTCDCDCNCNCWGFGWEDGNLKPEVPTGPWDKWECNSLGYNPYTTCPNRHTPN